MIKDIIILEMIITVIILVCLCSSIESQSRVKYCYVCRSRGSLGDCGDPFPWNQTTVKDLNRVEASPCPSGWCGKSIEGKEGDSLVATERMCLQRPPEDQLERCSETFYENKREPLFMCFCRGHLCNRSSSFVVNLAVIAVMLFLTPVFNQVLFD